VKNAILFSLVVSVLLLCGCNGVETDTGLYLISEGSGSGGSGGSGGGGGVNVRIAPTTIDNNDTFNVSWTSSGQLATLIVSLDNQATRSPAQIELFTANLPFILSPVACLYTRSPSPHITCTGNLNVGGTPTPTQLGSVDLPFDMTQTIYATISYCTFDLNIGSPTFGDLLCDNTVTPMTFLR